MNITTSRELLDALRTHMQLDPVLHTTSLGKDISGFPQEVWIKCGSCELYITHYEESDDGFPFLFSIEWSGNEVLGEEFLTIEEGCKWSYIAITEHIVDWKGLRLALQE